MKKFITLLLFLSTLFSYAQIGIGTDNPDPSAAIDIVSSNSGMLLPRLKMSERDNIANPAQGLMIYCTDCGSHGQLQLFNGSSWFGLSLTDASSNDMDNDGYTNDVDCDDTNPNINPGATEACNGIDDDCDGGVDNYTTNQTCTAGVGACQNTGHIICENGILVCDATPNNPTNEICGNGIDDDCDGITDYSYTTSVTLDAEDSASVRSDNFENYDDNNLRVYSKNDIDLKVNGFIKFNLSSLPDNAEVNSISLTLVKSSTYNSPNLDIYYVETDGWSRTDTPANGFLLTTLLNTNNTSFDATNTYELDLTAWDISSDLTDNTLTIGLTTPKNDYSYVYFQGSDDETSRPVLIVSYTECD